MEEYSDSPKNPLGNLKLPNPPTPHSRLSNRKSLDNCCNSAWCRLFVFQCASPDRLWGRLTYFNFLFYQYWTNHKHKKRTKCSPFYYSHSVNKKQDSTRLTFAYFSFSNNHLELKRQVPLQVVKVSDKTIPNSGSQWSIIDQNGSKTTLF